MTKTNEIRAHFLPALVSPENLAGGVSVIFDVLRATTTITAALAAGAKTVIPCLEIEDAHRVAANLPAGQVVLGGERGGVQIEGFDLGNSPSEYTPQNVGGKTVVFTTTNGTRAMLHARLADEIWLGSFVNLRTVATACVERERIDLLCAGTAGQITREDVLAAGAIVSLLTASAAVKFNDQAAIAHAAWTAAQANTLETLRLSLRNSQGGRNLTALHLERDIDDAAALDRYTIVPRFDAVTGRIDAK